MARTTAKKAPAKKAAARKSVAKKAPARRSTAKKTTVRKAAAKPATNMPRHHARVCPFGAVVFGHVNGKSPALIGTVTRMNHAGVFRRGVGVTQCLKQIRIFA